MSDDSVILPTEPQEVLNAEIRLPFVADKENNPPSVSVNVQERPEDSSLIELDDWTVSSIDMESDTCVLSCSLSVDTDKLYKMKELPVVEIEVKTKDRFKSHKHAVKLHLGTVYNL